MVSVHGVTVKARTSCCRELEDLFGSGHAKGHRDANALYAVHKLGATQLGPQTTQERKRSLGVL